MTPLILSLLCLTAVEPIEAPRPVVFSLRVTEDGRLLADLRFPTYDGRPVRAEVQHAPDGGNRWAIAVTALPTRGPDGRVRVRLNTSIRDQQARPAHTFSTYFEALTLRPGIPTVWTTPFGLNVAPEFSPAVLEEHTMRWELIVDPVAR